MKTDSHIPSIRFPFMHRPLGNPVIRWLGFLGGILCTGCSALTQEKRPFTLSVTDQESTMTAPSASPSRPADFVCLTQIDPSLQVSVRYATTDNFLGRPARGYQAPLIFLTHTAAQALKKAHDIVKAQGYSFVVYDGYRPQQAVNDFYVWHLDLADQTAKALYYPTLDKQYVFEKGFIAKRSGHSRGSTVDLTLIPLGHALQRIQVRHKTLATGETIPFLDDGTLDMGGSFDLFHDLSHHDSPLATCQELAHRQILRDAMHQAGFQEYSKEWWHYTLRGEPYPETYFDFEVAP
jgi:D-alanyl-D-alanine dipeptidase